MASTAFMQLMPAICTWLDANDIPHDDVPITEIPTITGHQVIVTVFTRPRRVNSATGDLVRRRLVKPLLVPPPTHLRDWLAGKVRP